jgi:hypothetical protein
MISKTIASMGAAFLITSLSLSNPSSSPIQWTNSENALFVIGQPDFTSNLANHGGNSASSLAEPRALAVDSTNDRLYVSFVLQKRILVFGVGADLPVSITNWSAE